MQTTQEGIKLDKQIFGFIRVDTTAGDPPGSGKLININAIDIDHLHNQAQLFPDSPCRITISSMGGQRSFCVKENPAQIIAKIKDHDEQFFSMVMDFAKRNELVVFRGNGATDAYE